MCETITMEEFHDKVMEWRGRYAVNALSLLPRFDRLGWFEDKRVSYNEDGTVTLSSK